MADLWPIKLFVSDIVSPMGNKLLSPPHGGFGYFRSHGPRDQRKIALTFDDGPSKPCTETLLDSLGKLNVKATFFCTGMNVRWHPDVLLRAHAEGHIIGNHSMAHRRMASLVPGRDGQHIDEGAKVISEVLGLRPRLYRPPWGWLTPWEARRLLQRGYTIIGWDVYTLDWQWHTKGWEEPFPDVIQVAEKARQDTRPGSILLFHDTGARLQFWDRKETAQVIEHIVPALRDEGYEFVTIPELLNVPAYATLNRSNLQTSSAVLN